MPPLRVERFSHGGRLQGSPLRRFSAAIQNGASGRPRPTKGESLQSGQVRTPAPTADAEASCPFVGAGHWPARQMASAIPEPTLIRLAYARHLLPGREKAFGRLIAAPTNRGERSQNRAGGPGVPPLRVERLLPQWATARVAPTADAEASRLFVGAGHWPARRSRTSKHLLSKARRGSETAPTIILANPGPSGPAEIGTSHSDFARRKCS